MVSCPDFPGPSEENSGSLAQILVYSSQFNSIHVYSGLFKFIQAHSSLFKVQGLAPCSLGYWSLCYWLTSWSRPITPPPIFSCLFFCLEIFNGAGSAWSSLRRTLLRLTRRSYSFGRQSPVGRMLEMLPLSSCAVWWYIRYCIA